MTWVDWVIVIVLAASVIGGLSQGLFRSVCSLGGLILGLVLAAWNYGRVAAMVLPVVHSDAIADAIGFLLIAFSPTGAPAWSKPSPMSSSSAPPAARTPTGLSASRPTACTCWLKSLSPPTSRRPTA